MMNRRNFKFRVWNVKNEFWMDPDKFNLNQKPLFSVGFYEEFEFSQFTGLTDSAGKEVYEGDILVRTYDVVCFKMNDGKILEGCVPGNFSMGKQVFSEVKWIGTSFDFGVKNQIGWHQKDLFKVVGNIFENPELCSTK